MLHLINRRSLLVCVITCWVALGTGQAWAAGADLILTNGHVYTDNPKSRWAEAVAVKGGKITYVGSNSGAKAKSKRGTREIDLGGRLLLPGFIDLNNQVYSRATELLWANLGSRLSQHTLDGYRQSILDYRARNPGLKQIRGWGFDPWILPAIGQSRKRQPRQLLDDIVSDVPAIIISWTGQQAWANSKAIELAGLTKDTPDPAAIGDYFAHDPVTGEPNGLLYGPSAFTPVIHKLPEPDLTIEQYRAGILSWQRELAPRNGVTGVQVPPYEAPNLFPALQQLSDEGLLTARYSVSQWATAVRGEAQVPELIARRAKFRGGRYFKLNAIKMLGPWAQDKLNPTVAALDKQGFQVFVHNVGDTASYAAILDAFEYASKQNGSRDSRHFVAFARDAAAPLAARFKSLGVRVVADWRFTSKSFYDAEVPTTISSDYPTRDMTLLPRIADGVKSGLALDDLIDSATIRGAEGQFTEKEAGSIKVGKAADLIVLDKDLFKVTPEEIAGAKVLLTLFAGEELYRDPSFD